MKTRTEYFTCTDIEIDNTDFGAIRCTVLVRVVSQLISNFSEQGKSNDIGWEYDCCDFEAIEFHTDNGETRKFVKPDRQGLPSTDEEMKQYRQWIILCEDVIRSEKIDHWGLAEMPINPDERETHIGYYDYGPRWLHNFDERETHIGFCEVKVD